MKTQTLYPRRQPPSTLRLLWYFTLACLAFAAVIGMTSCGGTFQLRPDGTLSYTTPEIIRPGK